MDDAPDPTVELSVVGRVARLVLRNPRHRNALTPEMLRGVPAAVRAAEQDPAVRVLVISGEGGHFSAGADIGRLDEVLADRGAVLTRAEDAIAGSRLVSVAAVAGNCVGGGVQLALACDTRVAASTAVLGVTPARLGIMYPVSGVRRLVAVAGPARARRLLFTGELVDARTALSWGLVDQVVAPRVLGAEVARLADTIARRSGFSIAAADEVVGAVERGEDADAVDAAWSARMGEDRRIGVAAFLEHEEPAFPDRSWTAPRITPDRG